MSDPHTHVHDDDDHGEAHHRDHQHHHEHNDTLIARFRSMFVHHSHDVTGSLDQELVASSDGMRALKVSVGILLLTACIELVIVAVSGSVALLGDTIHNFADALTAVPLGLAFWLGRRPATKRYTYGYGRAEDLAGVVVVGIIAASAGFTAFEAIDRLIHPQSVHEVGLVIAAGLVGFVGNELVARYRIQVGKRIGSAALVADGLHARTDGITSIAVVVGAVGVAVGIRAADPIMGLVITVAILVALRSASRDIYRRLMDSVDPAIVHQIEGVLAGVDGVEHVDEVRVRWVGHELRAQAIVVSDGQRSLAEAHAIAEEAHHRLLHEVPRLTEALIHSDPGVGGLATGHDLTAHHFAQGS